jgi:hypothetical protein
MVLGSPKKYQKFFKARKRGKEEKGHDFGERRMETNSPLP